MSWGINGLFEATFLLKHVAATKEGNFQCLLPLSVDLEHSLK